jgi:hypothetical protein
MFPVRAKQFFAIAAFVALVGCSSQAMNAIPSTQTASHAISSAPAVLNVSGDDSAFSPDVLQIVGVRLNGEAPFNSPRYGTMLGYFRGTTSTTSQVVMLTAAMNVIFHNVDTIHPHTASFLGNATKNHAMFPPTFTGSSTAAPAGTAIGTPNFSSGIMNPGTKSLKYSSGPPGFYMFGCFFHFVSFGMRTVIVVK